MNSLYLLAEAVPAENPAQVIARQFHWEPRLFISQVVLFLVVAFILSKFAFKPIQSMLEERSKRIEDSLSNAEKIKTELARTEASRQEILDKANVQANKLIEEARAAAARVQEQETQKAVAQAAQIVAKAQEATVTERAKMLTELKREVGNLVVRTTTAVTGKVLTPDDHKRLAEETSRQLN